MQKIIFGRKVALLGGTANIWFVIIQNVNGKIRAKMLCAYFINDFMNPMSARQVVRSFRSLVVEIR